MWVICFLNSYILKEFGLKAISVRRDPKAIFELNLLIDVETE